jgi:hypothetical protein
MSTHLAVVAVPVRAVRPAELGATGLQGRGARPRSDFRSEIRALLTHSAGRHRVTFIPLDKYAVRDDWY